MNILTVNSGSTSVKLGWYESGGPEPVRRHWQQHADDAHAADVLRALAGSLPQAPAAIAHRVVHGGPRFSAPVRIDAQVRQELGRLSELAPLHNARALAWIEAAAATWPAAVQVAVFDTGFFRALPRVAAEYAVAPELSTRHGVRRYGFHGLAHEAMWRAWQRAGIAADAGPGVDRGPRGAGTSGAGAGTGPDRGRIITLQLGGGCSMAAIEDGRPLDTSMGFSPLEGLVMATRSGDIDAAVVPYLQHTLGLSAAEVVERLNRASGLAGMTGSDGGVTELLAGSGPQPRFALDLYCYRIRKYLGAYLAVLGGCDGIVFGGGVGEHVPEVRARVLGAMEWAGIALDPARNSAARGGPARIDAAASRTRIHVVSVDEESILLRAAMALAAPTGAPGVAPA